jgi:hypothetical protein
MKNKVKTYIINCKRRIGDQKRITERPKSVGTENQGQKFNKYPNSNIRIIMYTLAHIVECYE